MSARAGRSRPVRACRRQRRELDLDLNSAPPSEIPEAEDNLSQDTYLQQSNQHGQRWVPPLIDVDAIDDDDVVVLSSPQAFAEAQRNRARSGIVDVESEGRITMSGNHRTRCRRITPNQSAMNPDLCINLETNSNAKIISAKSPLPAPNGPTFSCPICLGPLVDGTTTKCGHIFCKACIKAAIAAQGKCPTCRKPVVAKDLIRVFLPAAT